MKTKKLSLLLIIYISIILSGCNGSGSDVSSDIESFHEYIYGITSGEVKRNNPIVVKFTNEMVSPEEVGSKVASSVLSFSPSIDGKAVWVSRDAIEFRPSEPLDWDKSYKGKLKLSKLIKVPSELSVVSFQFYTSGKSIKVIEKGLMISDSEDGTYTLPVEIITSDVIEDKDIESIFSVKQGNEKLPLTWTHQSEALTHSLLINNIKRKDKKSTVTIEWAGNKIDLKGGRNSIEAEIPSKFDFSISSVKVINTPDQYIEVSFSDPVNSQMDMRGMIELGKDNPDQISIERNIIKIYPKERLTGDFNLFINKYIESTTGSILNNNYTEVLNFGGTKPAVRLIGNGVIIPQSSGLFFPFEAVSLSAVDVRITKIFKNNIHAFLQNNDYTDHWNLVQVGRTIKRMRVSLENKGAKDLNNWNSFNLDLSKIISIEPGVIYNIEIGFRKQYSLYPCGSENDKSDRYIAIEDEEDNPSKSYSSIYYEYYSNWEKEEDPCDQAYFSPYKFVKRNILGSNFGIISKTDQNKKTFICVSNLLTAEPESGVEVILYDYQNQLLTKAKTGSDGTVSVKTDPEPFLIIAKKGNETGYLKMDYSTNLSLSNFDVSGVSVEKGLKGFIYGERGVWRPGDTVYVSIILEDKLKSLPDGHPLIMEIYNPRGQFFKKIINKKDNRYIYPFTFNTQPDDPTGNWKATVTAGGAVFNKNIRIETIKPNRLKVDLSFRDKILSSGQASPGKIESKWLHGMAASDLKARVEVSFSSMKTSFEGYKDYDFTAPFDKSELSNATIFDGKLDGAGKADLVFDIKSNKSTSGFLNATFTTKIFEEGGDFSINSLSKIYSPYKEYVGSKIEWSDKTSKKLSIGKNHIIKVASVDENGRPVSLNGVKVKLFALEYDWWYSTNNENLASYAGSSYYTPARSYTVNTVGGKGEFSLNPDDDMWGRYLLLITSPTGHTSGQLVYFGWDWGYEKNTGSSQVLTLAADKENYTTGETVKIGFAADKGAKALVTIENGNGILASEWIKDLSGFSEYKFKATKEMAPNVYVSISMIQPHGQTVNDLPIRLYGVVPVGIEDKGTKLEPEINMPSEVRPLKEFTVKVSEKNNKPMDYTVAIVDEGLLDLTNFKTPDPWESFFAREALGVKTYDMYNYVMGSFGSKLESMFAVGGSDNTFDLSKKKADRFKPVVKVLGPFHLDNGRTGTHKIILPQYSGSVRAMVVAAGEGCYGSSEKKVTVKEPLMVLTTLPRTLAPDETVDMPVTVFALDESIKSVKVNITVSKNIRIAGNADTTINFSNIGEKVIYFKLKSSSEQGIASITAEGVSGNEKTTSKTELDIRTPNLPETQVQFKYLAAGEKWVSEVTEFGIPGTNKIKLEVSSLPPLNLGSRLEFLISYPHGCAEQTTSSVFPQLYLTKLIDLKREEENKTKTNISAGIEKLQKFQISTGGITYWPGNQNVDEWTSCYVAHFLIEAEKSGYIVSSGFKKDLLGYIKKGAVRFSANSGQQYLDMTQAYRLFVLSLAGDPQVAAMNRLKNIPSLNNQTKWVLAGAYALASMKDAAYSLIDFRNMNPDNTNIECYGSPLRDKSIMLITLISLKEWEQASKLALEISKMISESSWYSTQSTSFSLVALSSFASQSGSKEFSFKQNIDGEVTNVKSKTGFYITEPIFGSGGKTKISIENSGGGSLFVNLFNSGVKRGVDSTTTENGLILDVRYFDNTGKVVNPSELKQNTDFKAFVIVKNKTAVRLKNVALTQLFPSGWEIINERLVPGTGNDKNSQFDYYDIRDDRVNLYFSLDSYESKTFTVNLNAAYSGTYILAPVSCSEMYDNSYFAKTAGMKVRVVK